MWLWEYEGRGRRNDHSSSLANDMQVLRGWYRENLHKNTSSTRRLPFAWGYGFAWSSLVSGKHPLVLLTPAVYKSNRLLSSYDDYFVGPVPIRELLSTEELRELDLPKTRISVLAMVADIPRRSSLFGKLTEAITPSKYQICCAETGRIGTIGLMLDPDGYRATYLTAGHIFPKGKGSAIDYFRPQFIWKKRERLGSVIFHRVSDQSADWDVSIIRAYPSSKLPVITQDFSGMRGTRERNGEELIYANGAMSGFVDLAMLIGGLDEVAGWNIKWRCCWLIGPSGVLTNGDSGAAVFVKDTHELLGTYVGSSTIEGARRPHAHYVQDAWSLDQLLLKNHDISLI